MKNFTTEDEWEAICLKELKARAKATCRLGRWSDRELFKKLDPHAVIRGIHPYEDEPPSKLLDMAMFFSEIRELAGIKEKPFIQHTWPYLND